MSTITQTIGLEDRMSPTLSKIHQQAIANIKAYEQLQAELKRLGKAADDMEAAGNNNNKVFEDTVTAIENVTKEIAEYEDGTRNANIATEDMSSSMNNLSKTAMRLFGTYLSFRGLKQLVGLSDTFTQSTARLGLMNDGLQTTAELQDKIYYSAQRSRVSYQSMVDTVAKLGMQAKEAFSSNNEIIAFTEGLNKLFTVSGMDASSIGSVMYNLTQSMSTGRLLGNDYRILKMNAPKIVQLLKETYANGSQEALDEMVSKGQISAQMLKNAVLGNLESIEDEFNKMPVTFEQAWTKLTNTLQRMLIPVLKVISDVVQQIDKFFTFLSEHQYILWITAGALTAILAPLITYNTITSIATVITNLFSGAIGKLYLKFILITGIIALVTGVLIHFWNTNDDVANALITVWDSFGTAFQIVFVILKGVLWAFLKFIEVFAQKMVDLINPILAGLQALGFDVAPIKIDLTSHLSESIKNDLKNIGTNIENNKATRADRVANRNKIGYSPKMEDSLTALAGTIDMGADGGSSLRTTGDVSLKGEDLQLLLDIATRDFNFKYQQLTPEMTLNFTGDINSPMDIENVSEIMVSQLEEAMAGDLGVANA